MNLLGWQLQEKKNIFIYILKMFVFSSWHITSIDP